jgi:hypothetical protein
MAAQRAFDEAPPGNRHPHRPFGRAMAEAIAMTNEQVAGWAPGRGTAATVDNSRIGFILMPTVRLPRADEHADEHGPVQPALPGELHVRSSSGQGAEAEVVR